MGLRETYRKFFEPSDDTFAAERESVGWASGIIDLWENKVFREMLDRVEARAKQQMRPGTDVAGLASAIGRVNGINEILAMLQADLTRAKRIIEADRARAEQVVGR